MVLGQINDSAQIYYRLNKATVKAYQAPFTLTDGATLSIYAEDNYGRKSPEVTTKFIKIDPLREITVNTAFANQYNGGGPNALIDGYYGSNNFFGGAWQGYEGEDIDVIIDLGDVKTIESVSINFLEDQRSWIFLPTQVELAVGLDKKTEKFKTIELPEIRQSKLPSQKTVEFSLGKSQQRYIHLKVKNFGDLPPWHLGYGGQAWLFADEITIK